MKRINLFYIAIVATGILLFLTLRPEYHKELSFYGFAESRSTEINYNHSVIVEKIMVKPGQAVQAGEELLHLTRRKSREILEDHDFRIAELKAEEKLWKQNQRNEIEELRIEQKTKLAEINRRIESLQKELDYKKSLVDGLKSIDKVEASYKPMEQDIERFKQEALEVTQLYDSKIKAIQDELALGQNPYNERIKRFLAVKEFDLSQEVIPITVKAPTDGLVGNISCKEAEHISSYTTLMTFYEPHSEIIKGYVHEDLILEVKLGQDFTIASLKDENIKYPGKVIGLGSRIVEIPARLRKLESIKAYGREVLIEISKDNTFLQKEKVGINFIPNS